MSAGIEPGQRFSLSSRTALVTGASTGLGFASARSLCRAGARVILSSRGGSKLHRAESSLVADGHTVSAIPADLGNPSAIETLVAKAQSEVGSIDILVANNGGPAVKSALELTEDDWAQAIPQTLLFVPRLCRALVPAMKDRGWGRVVAINSVSARQPIPNLALSNALRPAVLGYLKTLSQEVAAYGVTVNAVLPGYTRTERATELASDRAKRSGVSIDEVFASQAQEIPAGRLADSSEVGDVVGFLCSEEASYVTGQGMLVEGGFFRGLP